MKTNYTINFIFLFCLIALISFNGSSQESMLSRSIPVQKPLNINAKVADKKYKDDTSVLSFSIKNSLKSSTTNEINYEWGKYMATSFDDRFYTNTIGLSGNIIVAGSKEYSSSDADAIIYMFDSSGEFLWSDEPCSSSSYDGIYEVVSDITGNLYVTGQFSSTGFESKIQSNGSSDIFIAKYNSNGDLLWAKNAGGTQEDYGSGIDVDPLGNIYVVGFFNGTSYWNNISKTSSEQGDMFIAKYDSNGKALWVRTGDIGENNYLYGISVDNSGNCYVSSMFESGNQFEGSPQLNSNGETDMFLIKYDTNGQFKWVKTAGGDESDGGNDVSVDHEGNIHVTGYFSGEAPFNNKILNSHGEFDIFDAKYSSNGTLLWVKQFGGNGSQSGWDVETDEIGNSYITGWFSGTGAFDNTTIVSKGGEDAYLIKYDKNGNLVWVEQTAAGINDEVCNDVSVKGRTIAISGRFEGEMDIKGSEFPYSGGEDAYVAKLTQSDVLPPYVLVNPGLTISSSQIKQGQSIEFSGQQFSPIGKVDLKFSGTGIINSIVDIPLEVNGSFQYTLAINSNQTIGDYVVTATDKITGKSVTRNFKIISNQEIIEDFLQITAPDKPETKNTNENIIITWSDKANFKNNLKHSYLVLYQMDNSSWQTMETVEGENKGYEIITENAQFTPSKPGIYKFKVIDNYNITRSKISPAITVVNAVSPDIKIEFVWDKSYEKPLFIASPIGVSADGVARFYIKVSNSSSLSSGIQKVNVSLSDPDGYEATQFLGKVKYCSTQNNNEFAMDGKDANSIEAENLSSNLDGSYWFWYVAPEDFLRNQGDWDEKARTVFATFQITLLNGNKLNPIKKEIKIVRPPLMLVHGLNGDSKKTWEEFPTANKNILFINDFRYRIKKAIAIEPNSHFETNSNMLLGTVYNVNSFRSIITEMRNSGYACNQVDYVCHSMGGSVLRHAVDNEANYKVKSNYNLGFVHKFITIHTPHDGSSFANLLYDLDKMGIKSGDIQRFATLFDLFKCGVIRCNVVDAVMDLRFKDGIKFSQTKVPSHLIGSYSPCSDLNWKANAALLFLKQYFFPPWSWFESNCSLYSDYFSEKGFEKGFLNASDAIVSASSQFSRENINLLPTWCSYIPGSMHNSMFGDSPTKSEEVGKEVDKLLNSNTKSNLFSYISATNVPPSAKSVEVPVGNRFAIAENKIKILYPTENQEFYAGDSMTIKLQIDTVGLEGLALYFQEKTDFSKPNNPIVEYKFYLSPEYIEGQQINIVGGYSISDTALLSYANLNIQINPVGQILDFNINPEVLMIEVGNSRKPNYEAIFENAIAQIGRTDLLNVVVKDLGIIAYDGSTNQFNGLAKGSTNATVTYRGISKPIFFEVIQNEEPPNDAITDVMDFKMGKNVGFNITAYPNPFNNEITFEFSVIAESDFKMEITNINGQIVKTYIFENQPVGLNIKTIDLSELSDGVYLYKLLSKDDYQVGKIVKKEK